MALPPSSTNPLAARPSLFAVVERLHAISLQQENGGAGFPRTLADHHLFGEQLVALDKDKAWDMYMVLRAINARRVVEAGTSHGTSLLWLLAAVLDNDALVSSPPSLPALVVGTELESHKAVHALAHVREAFDNTIPSALQLLEGDLLQTLQAANIEDGSIDALLLDIWAPLAFPTLKILLPKFRRNAVVFVDNSTSGATRYLDLLTYLRDPANGFLTTTLPHTNGFEMAVYVGGAESPSTRAQ